MVQRQIDWSLIDRVRAKNPIVLNLANLVTMIKLPMPLVRLERRQSCLLKLLKRMKW